MLHHKQRQRRVEVGLLRQLLMEPDRKDQSGVGSFYFTLKETLFLTQGKGDFQLHCISESDFVGHPNPVDFRKTHSHKGAIERRHEDSPMKSIA